MKKLTLVAVSAIALLWSPTRSWSADDSSANQPTGAANPTANPTANPNANPAANPMSGSPASAQIPPANWTSLKGTVQAVDTAAKTVQIKQDSGAVLQVPVDTQVSIKKDGKRVKLSQLQTGDIVILAKRNMTPQEGAAQEGSKTY